MGSRNAKHPTELEAARQELREAREQQAATSDVLKVISRSKADVQPVFDSVVTHAVRLCAGDYSFGYLRTPDGFRNVASAGGTLELVAIERGRLQQRDRGSLVGRVAIEERVIHIPDVLEDAEYALHAEQRAGGFRTLLGVPMKRDDGELVGVIGVARNAVRPFGERQIKLVETFAEQAAVAIENVRLFNETKEALERQTALAEILRVISGSPTDVQPVLDAIAKNAVRFCAAEDVSVGLMEGDVWRIRAHQGPIELSRFGEAARLGPTFVSGRSMIERRTIHVGDLRAHAAEYPDGVAASPTTRAIVATPLLSAAGPIGALFLRRTEATPFTERQIELAETFAAQAVIAIENVRLFNETKEALERQTAMSEVLDAINSSAFDLQPVLSTVIDNAMRLCAADNGSIVRFASGVALMIATAGSAEDQLILREAYKDRPLSQDRSSLTGRVLLESRSLQILDTQTDPDYGEQARATARRNNDRTMLGVPLIRSGTIVGIIVLRRKHVAAFTASEVALVEAFAGQAVVAMENARLFNDTREALERQTALAEILRVIAASPSDITPVLDAIAESAARFCVAENVSVILMGGDGLLQVRARVGTLDTRVAPWPVDRTTVSGRAIVEGQTIQVPDLQAAGDEFPLGRAQALVLNERTAMATPLIRDGRGIGVLLLRRGEVRPFSDKQVELVKVFADQAVIAIENVRLINEIQAKSAQLEGANQELAAASRHKSEFLANMSHELRTPLNAIIGFSDVLEQRLFGELNERQADYTHDIASSGRHLLDLVNEILDLSKVEAGKMELEPSAFDVADTIRGALAFVRDRAARHRIGLSEDVAADLGTIVADERKIRQVLLNLLSNAVKFTPDGGAIGVRARRTVGEVEVSVRDTGIGIAPEDQAKIFEEFQQVGRPSDRSREGTGLGLTLAKRFIELHGGRIWIESQLGVGTTFTFAIPVTGPVVQVTPGS